MLGKATAEFRKMTNDFRYALEDEVRELDRQNRIREQEAAMAATRAAQPPTPEPPALPAPENTVPHGIPNTVVTAPIEPLPDSNPHHANSGEPQVPPQEPVSVANEKHSDDNPAV